MRGASRRIERELEISNRHAYASAVLGGLAMSGKLPSFDEAFPSSGPAPNEPQSDIAQEAILWHLAALWGAQGVPDAVPDDQGAGR